jgi:hypothetical protein
LIRITRHGTWPCQWGDPPGRAHRKANRNWTYDPSRYHGAAGVPVRGAATAAGSAGLAGPAQVEPRNLAWLEGNGGGAGPALPLSGNALARARGTPSGPRPPVGPRLRVGVDPAGQRGCRRAAWISHCQRHLRPRAGLRCHGTSPGRDGPTP